MAAADSRHAGLQHHPCRGAQGDAQGAPVDQTRARGRAGNGAGHLGGSGAPAQGARGRAGAQSPDALPEQKLWRGDGPHDRRAELFARLEGPPRVGGAVCQIGPRRCAESGAGCEAQCRHGDDSH
ncbi:MAG: hypothetical protein CL454_00060 [Acidimicrobiaceae bacterium]|nr:hypothetical protein [Acidimicrobiaceae bacterium]